MIIQLPERPKMVVNSPSENDIDTLLRICIGTTMLLHTFVRLWVSILFVYRLLTERLVKDEGYFFMLNIYFFSATAMSADSCRHAVARYYLSAPVRQLIQAVPINYD